MLPRVFAHYRFLARFGASMALNLTLALVLVTLATTQASAASTQVYDRGPTQHARGTVYDGVYHVQRGDTIFSIANRFGVYQYELMHANGIRNPRTLQANSRLIIPGLGSGPPIPPDPPTTQPFVTITNPTWGAALPSAFTVSGRGGALFEGNVVVQARDRNGAVLAERATTLQGNDVGIGGEGNYSVQLSVNAAANTPGTIVAFSPGAASAFASVDVTYNDSASNAYLTITEPLSNASLPPTFTVRGSGRGLFEGNVVVQALDGNGRLLSEVATTLQGANVGIGGEGTWSVQLTVNQGVEGRILATSPGSVAPPYSVPVRFNWQGPGPSPGPSGRVKDFRPGECGVWPRAGAQAYGYPEGPQRGTFSGGQEYDVTRGVFINSIYWYYVDIAPGSGSPYVWVRNGDLANTRGACTW